MLSTEHWLGSRPVQLPRRAPLTLVRLSEPLWLAAMAWKVAGYLQAQMEPLGVPLQNYMAPLRLVLSPVDMAAIFINLEVRAQPHSSRAGSGPNLLQCNCPHQGHDWSWPRGVLMADGWEGENSLLLPPGISALGDRRTQCLGAFSALCASGCGSGRRTRPGRDMRLCQQLERNVSPTPQSTAHCLLCGCLDMDMANPCGKVRLDVVSRAGQLGVRLQKLRRGGLPPRRLVVVGYSCTTPQPLISSADPGPRASCSLCPRPSVLPAVSSGQHNRPVAWMGDVGSPSMSPALGSTPPQA